MRSQLSGHCQLKNVVKDFFLFKKIYNAIQNNQSRSVFNILLCIKFIDFFNRSELNRCFINAIKCPSLVRFVILRLSKKKYSSNCANPIIAAVTYILMHNDCFLFTLVWTKVVKTVETVSIDAICFFAYNMYHLQFANSFKQ